MARVAVIGAGNMGSAIIKSLKADYRITASDSDPKRFKGLGVKTTTDNKIAINRADVIILAVKPQNINSVLSQVKGAVKHSQLIVSIAAGITTKSIEKELGRIPVIRVMPNTPLLAGEGMSVLCAGRYARTKDVNFVKKILLKVGKVIQVKQESLMDTVTAISGSGPAYVFLFIELLIKAGIALGLTKKDAEILVAQTFKGSLKLLEKTGKTPEELRRQVTSPGGTTEAALKVFEGKVLHEIIHTAVKSAHRRSKELSK